MVFWIHFWVLGVSGNRNFKYFLSLHIEIGFFKFRKNLVVASFSLEDLEVSSSSHYFFCRLDLLV